MSIFKKKPAPKKTIKKTKPSSRPSSASRRNATVDAREKKPKIAASPKKRAPSKRVKKTQNIKPWFSLSRFFLKVIVWGTVFAIFLLGYLILDMPDSDRLTIIQRRPGITVLSKDYKLVATIGDTYGAYTGVDLMPKHVWQAVLAVEDRRFFSHKGIDPLSIGRAIIKNIQADRVVEGASTLTQQLAKNFFMAEKKFKVTDRSYKRKAQEVLFSFWLEHNYTKKEILSMYMNRVYLGSGVFGVDAAAQKYFGVRATELSLYQSAVIAGLLKAPSRYSPLSNPQRAHGRARVVLKTMVASGFITQKTAISHKEIPKKMLVAYQHYKSSHYFVDWIEGRIADILGDLDEDIVVVTTLDQRLQKHAEKSLESMIKEYIVKSKVSQGAVISMTYDGAVRSLVGGVDYVKSQFNRATQAHRQLGSVVKPFAFLAALERGWKPSDKLSDEKICFKGWCPKNCGWRIKGVVTVQDAMTYSINTAIVRLTHQVGFKHFASVINRLGISDTPPKDLTAVLGSMNGTLMRMTKGFACMANGGREVQPFGVTEIQDRFGHVKYKHQPKIGVQILRFEDTKNMTAMMKNVMKRGTGRRARIDAPCAGKSGTSQEHRDAWFVGYALSPKLVTGVWLGNDDNSPMNRVFGGTLPAILWKKVMR